MSTPTEPKVRTSLDERGVLTVTLADPDNRNTLSRRLVADLVAAMDRADTDDAVRLVVLTNEGRVFCAGADLSERSAPVDPDLPVTDPAELFGRIRRSPKVWVGRIAGHTVAGGMGLAAACDLSVVDESVKMGFTEVRIGVAPAMISVLCLPKMRRIDAAEAFLRGNRFPGARAAELGLVNRAVPADRLDGAVEEYVADLLEGAPQALAASKRLLAEVPEMGVDEGLAWTGPFSASLFESADAQEGMAAYLEKRPPSWSPRAGGTAG